MDIPQDINIKITHDIAKIQYELEQIQKMQDENQISQQSYNKKIYVLLCKAATLKSIIDEVKAEGVKLSKHHVVIDDILESLSENVDIKNMDEWSEIDDQSVCNFAAEYSEVMPDEFMQDLMG